MPNAYPSVLRRRSHRGSFVEGWAMYAEDLMADTGFRSNGDPLYVLVQCSQVRAAGDQQRHSGPGDPMSTVPATTEAMKLMSTGAFQEQGEADGKWSAPVVSSGQLSTYFRRAMRSTGRCAARPNISGDRISP